jgi:hypothetical protein
VGEEYLVVQEPDGLRLQCRDGWQCWLSRPEGHSVVAARLNAQHREIERLREELGRLRHLAEAAMRVRIKQKGEQ